MGRALQVLGLLVMALSLSGLGLVSSGNPAMVALADPCVPSFGASPSASPSAEPGSPASPGASPEPSPVTSIPPGDHPRPVPGPNDVAAIVPIATVAPQSPTPVPSATPRAPQQLQNYPVFAPSENISTPEPTPTPAPVQAPSSAPSFGAVSVAAASSLRKRTHRVLGHGRVGRGRASRPEQRPRKLAKPGRHGDELLGFASHGSIVACRFAGGRRLQRRLQCGANQRRLQHAAVPCKLRPG